MHYTPVTPKTFFTDYLLNPLSKEISKTDRKICLIASVILGILTLGLLHLGFAIYHWSQRDVINQTRQPEETDPLLPPIPVGRRSPETQKDVESIDDELASTLLMIRKTGLEQAAYARVESLANQIVSNAKQLIIECTQEPELRRYILDSTKCELMALRSIGAQLETDEACLRSFNEVKWAQDMISAIRSGNAEALQRTIQEGIDINQRAPVWLRGTILHHLAKLGRYPLLVETLASNGIDFNATDNWGNTALIWAIANGNNSMAEKILDYKQNLDVICHGNSSLHLALAKGYKDRTQDGTSLTVSNLDLAKKMLKQGADPNILNRCGFSALHIACIRRDREMVEALLIAGANPSLPTRDGRSCMELLELSHEEASAAIRSITPPFLLPERDFNAGYEPCKALFKKN